MNAYTRLLLAATLVVLLASGPAMAGRGGGGGSRGGGGGFQGGGGSSGGNRGGGTNVPAAGHVPSFGYPRPSRRGPPTRLAHCRTSTPKPLGLSATTAWNGPIVLPLTAIIPVQALVPRLANGPRLANVLLQASFPTGITATGSTIGIVPGTAALPPGGRPGA